MTVLTLYLAARIRQLLHVHAPTNIAIDAMRRQPDRIWMPFAALAAGAAYLYAMSFCAVIIEAGGPGWVNLLVLLFFWNAIKLTAGGILGLIRTTVAISR